MAMLTMMARFVEPTEPSVGKYRVPRQSQPSHTTPIFPSLAVWCVRIQISQLYLALMRYINGLLRYATMMPLLPLDGNVLHGGFAGYPW